MPTTFAPPKSMSLQAEPSIAAFASMNAFPGLMSPTKLT
jgi:hypothetical protein